MVLTYNIIAFVQFDERYLFNFIIKYIFCANCTKAIDALRSIMDELIERIAEEITEQIYNKVINKLNARFNLEDIVSDNTDNHDYIPLQNISDDERAEIAEQLSELDSIAASDHTYQRAAERGITKETLQKLIYCTEKNVIGIQKNGRLRIGIRDKNEVVVCICCIKQNTATIITCWRTNIVNYEDLI